MFWHYRESRLYHELFELSEGHVLAYFVNPSLTNLNGVASQKLYHRTVGVAVTQLPSLRAVFANFHSATAPVRLISIVVARMIGSSNHRKHPWNVGGHGGEIRRVQVDISDKVLLSLIE